jgi:2',3'-cyclic-nucleotide 2'-phosphodiesterase (5'-nucleotidase family)
VTNAGGIRAPLPSGAVTLGDTVAILPFDNTIVAVEISGAELVATLNEGSRPRVAGIAQREGEWILTATGEPPVAERIYRVLVNSFMYAGGDGYERFASADPAAYDTGTQYGLPFRDWLRSLASSETQPLTLLD